MEDQNEKFYCAGAVALFLTAFGLFYLYVGPFLPVGYNVAVD